MTVFNYDELKISAPDTPLSVDRWNGLVDQLNRVERTLNSVYQNGRIGIGTVPDHALHIQGTGGLDDKVFIHSRGSSSSAELIFAKSSPRGTPVKKGNLLGKISFRGETGEGFSGEACMRAYAIKDFKGKSAAEADLRFYTLGKGKMQENLRLMSNKVMLAYGDLEVSKSTEIKGHLKVHKNLTATGRVTADTFTGSNGARLITRKGRNRSGKYDKVELSIQRAYSTRHKKYFIQFYFNDKKVAAFGEGTWIKG